MQYKNRTDSPINRASPSPGLNSVALEKVYTHPEKGLEETKVPELGLINSMGDIGPQNELRTLHASERVNEGLSIKSS